MLFYSILRKQLLYLLQGATLKFHELKMSGTGNYDIGITVEPMPHLRGNRSNDEGYIDGIILLARLKGGTMSGATQVNSYELNLMAPVDVEDYDGSRIILASFECHSLMLESAHNGIIRYKGFLSAAEAHTQEVYDSLVGLKTTEEFEKVSALTTATGRLKYFPPVCEGAQQFIGWQANITMKPYLP
jgi:hypothetical protein